MSQESTVPKRSSPRSARSLAPFTWSRIHAILLAEKCRRVTVLQDLPALTGEERLQQVLRTKDNVAIRTKGASSLDDVKMMKSDRYSFTMKLNKYEKGQDYHGLSKLLLDNNIWDATQMKDAVVYDMCRYIGLPAPLTNYSRITLNGKFFGCYLMVEPVDKNFARRNIHFYINRCGFHAVEFFNEHHPDSNMPEQFDQEDGLFKFEKRMK